MLAILFTICVALVLTIIPVPIVLESFRPDWVLLCLTYWVTALPRRANVGVAFICGLLLDVLLGSTLGVRALALSIVAYLIANNYTRVRNYSVWQQALIIGVLCGLNRLIVFWAEHVVHDVRLNSGYFIPIVSSIFVWPWVFLILRRIRRTWDIK
ncbi:rod shape-determining protein MreD [Alginatibacterium sediminis]|uniref:Rod shape-determining protein MreD n=1 Tax=Alginatibacterium sediminis TaxID=2164068 RepID=A0A420EL06_9ALTE|nr:rod shape-determining protein MreD [Alginatibacterium sediminis]RKF21363.1 rod shape-determining protein MreD [Alginatibacterium sediminis]